MSGYYKVIGKKLTDALNALHERKCDAMDAMCRFSRRNGGNRRKVGIALNWGRTEVAIEFKSTPDRKIWKQAERQYDKFWIPKCSGSGKKLRQEFDELERAFPHQSEVSALVQFKEFYGFQHINLGTGRYNGVWVIHAPSGYTPKKGLGLRRISDVHFEKMSA